MLLLDIVSAFDLSLLIGDQLVMVGHQLLQHLPDTASSVGLSSLVVDQPVDYQDQLYHSDTALITDQFLPAMDQPPVAHQYLQHFLDTASKADRFWPVEDQLAIQHLQHHPDIASSSARYSRFVDQLVTHQQLHFLGTSLIVRLH